MESCVPLAPVERITGTWTLDAEGDAFAEEGSGTRRLVYEGTQLEDVVRTGRDAVLEVEFVGRRPLCGLEEVYPYIVVDRVLSRRVID
ncbi:hypothetical protein [Alteraurantiacibacter aquimixticola]|uniref:Uncharacterized protein n=1 Tax=Alteraurantiacibacter aquimixticola TaxID=2489173 RepID=A0A4T3EXL2_9SPHN|nr:hypothetical protein [Alteraurantiacibacter aquimixticola]TIX49388.1 hypothetical protein E5222_11050 [Alteraurantiacibacter aquimixticola]